MSTKFDWLWIITMQNNPIKTLRCKRPAENLFPDYQPSLLLLRKWRIRFRMHWACIFYAVLTAAGAWFQLLTLAHCRVTRTSLAALSPERAWIRRGTGAARADHLAAAANCGGGLTVCNTQY